ncbi:MAG: calcium/proton exchanger [Synechococcus sp.]|nr:calcium/proton exchanger [Synechococcus sp.]
MIEPRNRWSLAMLLLVPLPLLAQKLQAGDGLVCLLSGLAILPLAVALGTATEELALALGPTLGTLLTALFGNASELIIAVSALRAGLVEIVKASITGTVLANLLLALGLSFLLGGIGRSEQTFTPASVRVNGSLMTLAVLAILIPSLSHLGLAGEGPPALSSELAFSRFVAWLLLLVYGLTLVFSLGTHRRLRQVAVEEVGGSSGPETPPVLPWLLVLLAATAGLAWESETFVGVLEPVTEGLGLSSLFTGVVLLPLLGGVAEFVTAVSMARRDKIELAVELSMGSTLLVALLVVPLLVLVSPLLGHPLTLSFRLYELVAVIMAVVVSNLVSLDGRSNWLEGVLLLATYGILAAGFAIQTTPLQAAPLS